MGWGWLYLFAWTPHGSPHRLGSVLRPGGSDRKLWARHGLGALGGDGGPRGAAAGAGPRPGFWPSGKQNARRATCARGRRGEKNNTWDKEPTLFFFFFRGRNSAVKGLGGGKPVQKRVCELFRCSPESMIVACFFAAGIFAGGLPLQAVREVCGGSLARTPTQLSLRSSISPHARNTRPQSDKLFRRPSVSSVAPCQLTS